MPEIVSRELIQAGSGTPGANAVLLNTLDRPDHIAAEASCSRLELAKRTGALTLALDLADTVGAQNSIEKMLVHQMATAHCGAMNLMQLEKLAKPSTVYPDRLATDDGSNVRAARLAGSAARLMACFQQGFATLHKIRSGGKQEVHVHHHKNVQVNDGGQAVVAGKIGEGRRRAARPGEQAKNDR